MKSHRITLDGQSVRAILDGIKTQFRKPIKPQPPADAVEAAPNGYEGPEGPSWFWMKESEVSPMFLPRGAAYWPNTLAGAKPISCPYGKPGDELWVLETWGCPAADHPACKDGRRPLPGDRIVYDANPADSWQWQRGGASRGSFVWRSPVTMPLWASRLTLRVTDLRAERITDISEEDAKAEGVKILPYDPEGDCWTTGKARSAFEYWWGETYGWPSEPKAKAPFDPNLWVWAITFERVEAAQ